MLSDACLACLPERSDATPGETGPVFFPSESIVGNLPSGIRRLQDLENQLYVTMGDLFAKGDKLMLDVKEDQDDYAVG